jgi:hypothetical protein
MDAKSVVDSGRGRSGFCGGCSGRRQTPPIRSHVLASSLDACIRSASQVSLLKGKSPFPALNFLFLFWLGPVNRRHTYGMLLSVSSKKFKKQKKKNIKG